MSKHFDGPWPYTSIYGAPEELAILNDFAEEHMYYAKDCVNFKQWTRVIGIGLMSINYLMIFLYWDLA